MRTDPISSNVSVQFPIGRRECRSRPEFEISTAEVDALKKLLSRKLQQVKCSHRVEALARGMGWQTNAAMRVALAKGTQTVAMDGAAFTEFLEARGYREIDSGILEGALRQISREVGPEAEATPPSVGVPHQPKFDDATEIFFNP